MDEPLNNKLKNVLKFLFCSASLTLSVIPGFELLGNLLEQVLVTIILALISMFISDLIFKTEPQIVSNSLIFMTAFWVVYAIIKQIEAHIKTPGKSLIWFQLFYYDRPALLFVVFFVCIVYFIVKLLFKKDDKIFMSNYGKFIKTSTFAFLVYYSLILLYSFFLIRKITFERPVVNLKPFDMIIFTFSRGYIDYELLFLFLGNIAIFLPLGIMVSILTKKKMVIVPLPIVLSFLIELSQYFLGNGHPDIDDFMLNVIGFYIGVLLKSFFDFLVVKATKGKLKSFFVF